MFKYGGRIYPAMYQNNAVMVGNFITLLTVLLEHMAESTLQPIQYEKIIIFCIIWTLGSMFD